MDYNTLIAPKSTAGSLADWVNDSRIAGDAPYIIDEAMQQIYTQLRHWKMIAPPVTGVINPGDANIAWPSDMIEPYYISLVGTTKRELVQITPQECIARASYDMLGNRIPRLPLAYYFDNTYLQLDAPSDDTYPYSFLYFQRPATLTTANPTNFLLTDYPRLVRAAIMIGVTEWMKESGQGTFDRTYWMQVYTEQLACVQSASDRAKRAIVAGPVMIEPPTTSSFW